MRPAIIARIEVGLPAAGHPIGLQHQPIEREVGAAKKGQNCHDVAGQVVGAEERVARPEQRVFAAKRPWNSPARTS